MENNSFLNFLVFFFFVDFNPDFKHVVLSPTDELMSILYTDVKLEMSSFYLNLNHRF